MKEVVDKILNEYIIAKNEVFTGHRMGKFFRDEIPDYLFSTNIINSDDYIVKGSVGQGNWAAVPWIAILNKNVTTTVTKGVYIVYLLSKDGDRLYLTLNQGCTEIKNEGYPKRKIIEILKERAQDILSKIDSKEFLTESTINLGKFLPELAELYQAGTICYKEYKKSSLPEDEEMLRDLEQMISVYDMYVESQSNKDNCINDIEKFKKLLEIFVTQLRINNDIVPGEKMYGQGYRDMKIQGIYEDYRKYSNFILEITLQGGFNLHNSANYIHFRASWVNIVAVFEKNKEDKYDVIALQVINKPNNKPISNYSEIPIEQLGLFDGKEANELLIKFFNDFKNEYFNKVEIGKYDSWEIISADKAIKNCDKSFFEYYDSGVPQGICWFFDAENLKSGEKRDINLNYEGKSYFAKISNDSTDRRRVMISWSSDLGRLLSVYKGEKAQAIFTKKDKDNYDLEMRVVGESNNMTIKEKIEKIKLFIASKGFKYDDDIIENFYLSLVSKPFVILAGTSGTGKTKLVKLFAEAINAEMKLVPVRPDWSDSSDLFGHVDLAGNFKPGAIIDYIKEAQENLDKPYFLCLDEMNLARVEYYLSDFLSIIETRDYAADGKIVSDDLVSEDYFQDEKAKNHYGKLIIPENLYIIGTVNMDETTFPFSKKVLDRANTIEFSFVDFNPYSKEKQELTSLTEKNDFLKTKYLYFTDIVGEEEYISELCIKLQEINKVLEKANLHVGYRVRDEIAFYMVNNKKYGLIDDNAAFDNEIMQKILLRIQGSSSAVKQVLSELFILCAGDYTGLSAGYIYEQMYLYLQANGSNKYPKSARKIAFMMRRYEEDGFTSYWL